MIVEFLIPLALVCALAVCIFKRPGGFRRATLQRNSILRGGTSPGSQPRKTSSVAICMNGAVTFSNNNHSGGEDHHQVIQESDEQENGSQTSWTEPTTTVLKEDIGDKRKVSPADSGMYSTSSWCPGGAESSLLPPTTAAYSSTGADHLADHSALQNKNSLSKVFSLSISNLLLMSIKKGAGVPLIITGLSRWLINSVSLASTI
eukprot:sb/3470504/